MEHLDLKLFQFYILRLNHTSQIFSQLFVVKFKTGCFLQGSVIQLYFSLNIFHNLTKILIENYQVKT